MTTQTASTPSEVALTYLERGWSVIPLHEVVKGRCSCGRPNCPSPGKHVRLESWKVYQTRRASEEEIRAWWRKWPRSNIGIVMGRVSGIFSIDCDDDEKVAWVYDTIGVPQTETHLSAKGPHYLFLLPDFEVPTLQIGPAVEVKGEGSQIVAPPSVHVTGHVYSVETPETLPAPAPERLLDEIRSANEFKRGTRLTAEEIAELLDSKHVGDRHPTLRTIVGRWVSKGLTLPEIEVAALGWNRRNVPPKDDKAIIEQVRDMYGRWGALEGPDLPILNRDGNEFEFVWPKTASIVGVKYLQEVHDGLQGEVWVRTTAGVNLHWGRLKLASTSGRKDVVDKLRKTNGEVPWQDMLEYVCRVVTEEYRQGEPVQELKAARRRKAEDLVEDFIPASETTVLFSDGGVGKSTLALALGLSIVSGVPLPVGLRPTRRTNVLYLDWESNIEEHEDRLMALKAGMGIPDETGMYYRRCFRPITEDINLLKAEAQRLNVGLVIIDSFGPAASPGGDFTETGLRTMNAIREFAPATRLLVTHVPGYDARNGDSKSRPIGSVYVRNLARMSWFLKRSEEDNEVLAVVHDKANRGRPRPSFGLRFRYSEGGETLRISAENLADYGDLEKKMSVAQRVRAHLLRNGVTTVEEIARALDAKPKTVSNAVKTLEKKGEAHEVGGYPKRWAASSHGEEVSSDSDIRESDGNL